MKKLILANLIILLATSAYAQKNQITLSTYYPSPFGVYDRLRVMPRATLANPCDIGTFYFDSTTNSIKVCNNNGSGTGVWGALAGAWSQNGNNIYPTDTQSNPNIFVGVGTSTPEFKLSINGDGGILAKGTQGAGTVLTTAGAGTKLIWYPRKSAFRAGYVDGNQWDDSNIGKYSVAMGYNNIASFNSNFGGSIALGINNISGQQASVTLGQDNQGNGSSAIALGLTNQANRQASIALGQQNISNAAYSIAMGKETTTNGDYSTAMGYKTITNGLGAVAMGEETIATGARSTAIGWKSQSLGHQSFAGGAPDGNGVQNIASGPSSFAFGIGNLASGDGSAAFGQSSQATNYAAFAAGFGSIASGERSVAIGSGALAGPGYAVAIGVGAQASGTGAIAMGGGAVANCEYCMSVGRVTKAVGSGTFAAGILTEAGGGGGAGQIALGGGCKAIGDNAMCVSPQPITVRGTRSLGIALEPEAQEVTERNVFVIMGGRVGIGTVAPTETLHVVGNILATGSITPGSSREFKKDINELSLEEAQGALDNLNPIKFRYKADQKDDLHVGFIAEDVPDLLATTDRKGVDPMDVLGVLTKVVQEQQKLIEEQQKELESLKLKLNNL